MLLPLVLFLLLNSALSATPAGPFIATKALRTVCTTPYAPISDCNGGTYTGYEVELFKLSVDILARSQPEWAPGNWTWQCIDNWSAMLSQLAAAPAVRQCDVVVAGVSATADRVAQGLKFSYPTYPSGRRIMVHVGDKEGMWSFFKPLSPALWLALFATSTALGVVLLLSEMPWAQLARSPRGALAKAANMQWATLGLLVRGAWQAAPRSPGGRLMLLAYSFMVAIILNLYIAYQVAALHMVQMDSRAVSSMADLVDLPTGIFVEDSAAFRQFDLTDVMYLPWATDQDEELMLRRLRSGQLRALVLDAPWVQYTTALCSDLFITGETVLPVNLGFAFPGDTPDSYLAAFDSALAALDDAGVMDRLQRRFIRPPTPCHTSNSLAANLLLPQLKFGHVAGLWVLLGACAALGLASNLGLWLLRSRARPGLPPLRTSDSAGSHQANSSVHSTRQGFHRPSGQPGSSGAAPAGSVTESGPSCWPCLATTLGPAALSNSTSWLGMADAATVDEAMQLVEERLRQVDTHMKHLPFVLAAAMDSRLAALRAELLAALAAPAPALPTAPLLKPPSPRHHMLPHPTSSTTVRTHGSGSGRGQAPSGLYCNTGPPAGLPPSLRDREQQQARQATHPCSSDRGAPPRAANQQAAKSPVKPYLCSQAAGPTAPPCQGAPLPRSPTAPPCQQTTNSSREGPAAASPVGGAAVEVAMVSVAGLVVAGSGQGGDSSSRGGKGRPGSDPNQGSSRRLGTRPQAAETGCGQATARPALQLAQRTSEPASLSFGAVQQATQDQTQHKGQVAPLAPGQPVQQQQQQRRGGVLPVVPPARLGSAGAASTASQPLPLRFSLLAPLPDSPTDSHAAPVPFQSSSSPNATRPTQTTTIQTHPDCSMTAQLSAELPPQTKQG